MGNRRRAAHIGWVICAALGALAQPARAQEQVVGVASAASPWPDRMRLRVEVDTPADGGLVGDPGGTAFVAGRALAAHGNFQTFDVVFVIDQSESTGTSAGADVDGDGVVSDRHCQGALSLGEQLASFFGACRRHADTVLAAELQAVRSLLPQLDPRTTQVGVIAFSGDGDPTTPDAYVSAPLSSDYAATERALAAIEAQGPLGETNMLSGLQEATLELVGSSRGYGTPRRDARKIVLFLSDGVPTLPVDRSEPQNRALTVAAATKAHELGIEVDTYGIGPEATSAPQTLIEVAQATGGSFTPVVQPRDLRSEFERVTFAEIADLRITNRTTGREARYVTRNVNGSFAALVDMTEGDNAIEVYARATDGVSEKHRLHMRFLGDAPVQPLSPRLLTERSRLLENRLADLRSRRLAVEAARDDAARDAVLEDLDRERKKAERSRDVHVDPDESAAAAGRPQP